MPGPSGKVGDVGAEPTGNFVVVLTPLFPQSRDRASRRATAVKVSHLSERPPEFGLHFGNIVPYVHLLYLMINDVKKRM